MWSAEHGVEFPNGSTPSKPKSFEAFRVSATGLSTRPASGAGIQAVRDLTTTGRIESIVVGLARVRFSDAGRFQPDSGELGNHWESKGR